LALYHRKLTNLLALEQKHLVVFFTFFATTLTQLQILVLVQLILLRALMSDAKTGANHPMFGKTHTPETLA